MYEVAVKKAFQAKHFLFGGDWGYENTPHTHDYALQINLSAPTLDKHGFVFDIEDINKFISSQLERYEHQMLNDFIEFEGKNPSLEHFCAIILESLKKAVDVSTFSNVKVTIWEDEHTWCSLTL